MSFKLFCLWAFVLIGRPQDLFIILQPLRPALALTAIAPFLAFLNTHGTGLSNLFKMYGTKRYLVFYLVMILGIPFAYHRKVAFDFIFLTYIINILFFLVFLLEVNSIKRLKTVILTICLSVFLYSFFGLAKGSFSNGRFFIYGAMFDPNDIAYVLLSLLPLCLFYVVHKEGLLKKALAITTIGASIILILLTGSRAGIIGLITLFLLILFTKLERVRWFYKIALLIALFTLYLLNEDKINIERYMTITEIGSDYNVSDEFGRMQIWNRAYQLFLENPLTGVGVNCFSMALGYLRQELFLIPEWQAAHNSYIQIITETGLIGFILFLSLIIASLKNFLHIKNLKIITKEASELKAIAGLLYLGFIVHLITAFFLSQGYSMFFTLFFAFSAVLNNLSLNMEEELKVENENYLRSYKPI
jgi:O-antigen ligase